MALQEGVHAAKLIVDHVTHNGVVEREAKLQLVQEADAKVVQLLARHEAHAGEDLRSAAAETEGNWSLRSE